MKALPAAAAALAIASQSLAGDDHGATPARQEAFTACRAALDRARDRELIVGMEWRAPHRRAILHVGKPFHALNHAERQGIVDTATCFFLVGVNDLCLNMEFMDYDTGRHVGRGRNCRYLDGPGR